MSLNAMLLYGPVFEDDPAMVFTFNAEHLVGHALRGQVKCMERILNNGTAAVVTMYGVPLWWSAASPAFI